MTPHGMRLHPTPGAHTTASPPPPPPSYHSGDRLSTVCDMEPPSAFAAMHGHNTFGSVGKSSSSLNASHLAAAVDAQAAASAGPQLLPPTAIWSMAPINLQLTPPGSTLATAWPMSSLQCGAWQLAGAANASDDPDNARRTSYDVAGGSQPGATRAGSFNTSYTERLTVLPAHTGRASPQQHDAGGCSIRLSKGLLAATSAAAAAAGAAGIGLVSHHSLPLFLSGPNSSSAGSGWPASSIGDSTGRDQDQVKARREGAVTSSSSSSSSGATPLSADVSSPQDTADLLGSLGTALLDGSMVTTTRLKLDGRGMSACTDGITRGPSRLANSASHAALDGLAMELFDSRPPSFLGGILSSNGGSVSTTTAHMLLLSAGGNGSSNSRDPRLTSEGGSSSSTGARFSFDSGSFADAGQAVHSMMPAADASTAPGLWPAATAEHRPFAGLAAMQAQAGNLNGGSTLLARYLAAMAAAAAGTGTASHSVGSAADSAAAAAGTLLHPAFWGDVGCSLQPLGFTQQQQQQQQLHLHGLGLTFPPPAAPAGLYPVASWGAGYGSCWAATAHHHPAVQHQPFGGQPGGRLRSSHSVGPHGLGASCPPMSAAPAGSRCPPQSGSAALTSRADPRSLRGVDPRLCVGEPGDVEREVCRRNPGLADILRLAPRSVPLANLAVHEDTVPLEELTASKHAGRVDASELTLESGLLRYCFGLPSSVGPDLVRAARQAVTRNGAPGSGLEPFFWTLHAKMAWLLKRPVFFKGQLLRGEIQAITHQQRVESFARVTEQRSRLGELVVALYNMLRLPPAGEALEGRDEGDGFPKVLRPQA